MDFVLQDVSKMVIVIRRCEGYDVEAQADSIRTIPLLESKHTRFSRWGYRPTGYNFCGYRMKSFGATFTFLTSLGAVCASWQFE